MQSLVGLLAGAAGWSLAELSPSLWREGWVPWWREQVAPHLDLGGHRQLARRPEILPALLAVLMLLAAVAGGALWLLAVVAAAGALVRALPLLLRTWIDTKVERADRQLVSLLPELAAGVLRDESLSGLLDRLFEQITRNRGGSDDARFSPLLYALLRDSAAASRLAPALTNVCETLSRSPLPTARLVAQAWRQKPLGSDVPASFRFIAATVSSDYAFQDEIRRKISPVKTEGWMMIALPIGTVLLVTGGDMETLHRLISPPLVVGPIGAVVLMIIARAFLRSALQTLQ